jgi:hypothetical protein
LGADTSAGQQIKQHQTIGAKIMNDYTPAPEATPDVDVKKLQEDIAILNNLLGFAQAAVVSWDNRFKGIKAALTEFVDEDEIVEGSPLSDYLIEEFDLEMTKEVEVKITVYYSALITIPRKSDVEDFADYLDIPDNLSLSKGDIDRISVDDASIEEA